MDEIKRKIRKLKQLEIKIRFNGEAAAGVSLVWDAFFNLRGNNVGKSRYSLTDLASMSREEYKRVIDEYFAHIYYAYYRENGLTFAGVQSPSLLERLGLPFDADQRDIKKRFRELAKQYHPDTGGDADKFIELMQVYEKLHIKL